MVKKIEGKPVMRRRALALLARGMGEVEAAEELRRRYHSSASAEAVRSAYFPQKGGFNISGYVGAGRQEILERIQSMTRFSRKKREDMRKLHEDPEFEKRNTERLRLLHEDPEFARLRDERAAKTFRRLNSDPEFRRKMSEGISHFWYNWRLTRREAAKPVGWEGKKEPRRVLIETQTPEDIRSIHYQQKIILAALESLPPEQRGVLGARFGLDVGEQSLQAAGALSHEAQDAAAATALNALMKNPELQESHKLRNGWIGLWKSRKKPPV
ncbi:MAG: hypothetical protein V1708_01025 [Candidatus Micrarchaeota archaeon]